MQTRLKFLGLFFIVVFALLVIRLFFWQIIKGKVLSAQARSQYETGTTITATRGSILAKDGGWLAARGVGWLIYANLPDVKESPDKVAEKLAPFFITAFENTPEFDSGDESNADMSSSFRRGNRGLKSAEEVIENEEQLTSEVDRLKGLLERTGSVWIPLKHKISDEAKKNIEALDIGGIGFEEEEIRFYPEASSAAQILGFVGKNKEGEDTGYFGLEGYYDLALSGKPGFLTGEKDAKGIPILLGNDKEVSAIGGVDLITNINKGIEIMVEQKLTEGVEKYGAKGGSVIISDPTSGAIIAEASYPSYDPAKYFEFGNEYFKDPVVSDAFEPGSIFKVIIMASALDAGVVEPDTKCDICAGPLKLDKYLIETWNREYRPNSTMVDVIVHSDNVGMSFVGLKLGKDKLYDYLDKFGIGKLTGIDLQGEATPHLRDKDDWSVVDVATASFGQGVAVTPIQMVKAVSAIANGGIMVNPHVVSKLKTLDWQEDIKVSGATRVISEDAAKKITAMMVEAAKNGESKWTYLRGFKVAGKTGTAQIPIAGHYDTDKTIASFVGFAPADSPKFLMLVTLKEPASSQWASETAAPLWYSIAKDLFLYFSIQPE